MDGARMAGAAVALVCLPGETSPGGRRRRSESRYGQRRDVGRRGGHLLSAEAPTLKRSKEEKRGLMWETSGGVGSEAGAGCPRCASFLRSSRSNPGETAAGMAATAEVDSMTASCRVVARRVPTAPPRTSPPALRNLVQTKQPRRDVAKNQDSTEEGEGMRAASYELRHN
uniref:Uncharacterized protein n=1 Tax=Odontella aurita TaxID=265563 RepID=A0A7S4KBK9_9STRA